MDAGGLWTALVLFPCAADGDFGFVGAESLRPIGTIAKADVILALAGSTNSSHVRSEQDQHALTKAASAC